MKTVITHMEKYQKRLDKDIRDLFAWLYSNSGCSGTYAWAIHIGNRRANCATLPNWALKALKVLSKGQYFYGRSDGSLACSAETLKALKAGCTVMHINGRKTVRECIESGKIVDGDIVTYQHMQHVNVYGGGMVWYDAGRGNTKDCAEGSPFLRWKCNKVAGDDEVAYVIRYKGNPPAKKYYRVQIEALNSRTIADAKVVECKKLTGLDAFKERMYDGYYHVFCGSYADKSAANERLVIVKETYPKAFVKKAYVCG